jgi:hypothetical protein
VDHSPSGGEADANSRGAAHGDLPKTTIKPFIKRVKRRSAREAEIGRCHAVTQRYEPRINLRSEATDSEEEVFIIGAPKAREMMSEYKLVDEN